MQQTIFAIMALAVTMLISFNQLNSHTQSYARLIDDELEVMGSGIMRRVMETAEILSFDERTTPTVWNANGGVEPATTEFDLIANFGNVPVCDLDEPFKNLVECDDVDDLDMGSAWQDIPFYFPNGDSLMFGANVRVHYVSPADLDTPLTGTSRTEHKLMIIRLRSELHKGQARYTTGFAELRRVFSYNSVLAADRASAGP